MKFLKLVIFRPFTRYTFSATDEPAIEARLPKAESPADVPGARSTKLVKDLLIGVFAINSSTSIEIPVVVELKSIA